MKQPRLQPLLIPFTLLALFGSLLVCIIYKPSKIRYYDGCLDMTDSTPNSKSTTIWGRPGAQSWGCRINWYNTSLGLNDSAMRVHERTHTLHGEWVNAAAHLILVPLAYFLLGTWWAAGAALVAQSAFGLSYGAHFLFEWMLIGFSRNWIPAYKRIWSERIAHKAEIDYSHGNNRNSWGA